MMQLVSWNVNGIRAVMKKDFASIFDGLQCDVLCLQETKAQNEQVFEALEWLEGYHLYSNSAVKKGYSGTAIITRTEPISVCYGMGIEKHDQEGRIIVAEYESFLLLNVYTPNSGSGLKNLEYRQIWDADFLNYLQKLERRKPLIVCGDLNVAHRPIDLARPKPNYNKTAGYTQEEIDGMDKMLNAGFIDSYRHLKPDEVKYSWWSFRANARSKNIGWRIDYFLTSLSLSNHIATVEIDNGIFGSDHCPVSLGIKI